MLSLTLWIGLAFAQEADAPPDPPTADAAPTEEPFVPDAPVEPPVAPTPPPPPPADTLVWSSDPLGQGDDRTARAVEARMGEHEANLLACRDERPDSGRILSTQIKMNLDGSVKWAKAKLSTGDDVVDDCVLGILRTIVLDPPPQFGDKLRVNVRWKPPGEDDEGDEG